MAKNQGFTLIELILYVGLAGTILLGTSVLIANILSARIEGQAIAEVEGQSIQVLQIITQTIRNAEAVLSPLPGSSSSTLRLDVVTTNSDPTIFNLSGSTIFVQEGSGSPIPLTGSPVQASNLIFQNLARPNTSSSIRIQFQLSHTNPSGRSEYEYSKVFIGSATVR